MESTGLLLRQRGRGHVNAVRRANRRRMASVRAHSVVTSYEPSKSFRDHVIRLLFISLLNILQYEINKEKIRKTLNHLSRSTNSAIARTK